MAAVDGYLVASIAIRSAGAFSFFLVCAKQASIMYVIPDDDYDSGIKHAMLHADLSQIYHLSKGKRNLILPYEDRQKIIRKYICAAAICKSDCNVMQIEMNSLRFNVTSKFIYLSISK